tara:strand:+ start:691 stop:885 length:195 start_codon:yes stop_codon:yes gene_type:complete
MTDIEIMEIHKNNVGLNLLDLAKIHNSDMPTIRNILRNNYRGDPTALIQFLEPKDYTIVPKQYL